MNNGSMVNTLVHHCEAVLHLRFNSNTMVTCSKVLHYMPHVFVCNDDNVIGKRWWNTKIGMVSMYNVHVYSLSHTHSHTRTHIHIQYTLVICSPSLAHTHTHIFTYTHTRHTHLQSISFLSLTHALHTLYTGSHHSSVGHEISQGHRAEEGLGGAQGSRECGRL